MKHICEEKMKKVPLKRPKATIDMESGDCYQVGRLCKLDTRTLLSVKSPSSWYLGGHSKSKSHSSYPKSDWLAGSGLVSIQQHCLGMKGERRKETWKETLKEGNEKGKKEGFVKALWTQILFPLYSPRPTLNPGSRMSSGQGKRGLCVAHLHSNHCLRPLKSLPWYWTL